MSEFSEKAKSIGVSLRRGKSRRKLVQDDRDGSKVGYEVEHWDDRQDAVVTPKPIEAKLTVRGD